MRPMRTIRERLLESVANNLGHQVVYCDDDDVVHALELAAEEHPSLNAWWNDRIKDQRAIEKDIRDVRLLATEGGK